MNCTCSYEESEEMTKHAPLCAISRAATVRSNLYKHVANILEDDANNVSETFKEFWEDCADKTEVKLGEELLRELAARLRKETDDA